MLAGAGGGVLACEGGQHVPARAAARVSGSPLPCFLNSLSLYLWFSLSTRASLFSAGTFLGTATWLVIQDGPARGASGQEMTAGPAFGKSLINVSGVSII